MWKFTENLELNVEHVCNVVENSECHTAERSISWNRLGPIDFTEICNTLDRLQKKQNLLERIISKCSNTVMRVLINRKKLPT